MKANLEEYLSDYLIIELSRAGLTNHDLDIAAWVHDGLEAFQSVNDCEIEVLASHNDE